MTEQVFKTSCLNLEPKLLSLCQTDFQMQLEGWRGLQLTETGTESIQGQGRPNVHTGKKCDKSGWKVWLHVMEGLEVIDA